MHWLTATVAAWATEGDSAKTVMVNALVSSTRAAADATPTRTRRT